ncbi:HupE/UreJ family protein [Shewanella sp. OMA3-2]|nr:HupE/UreJ family protein [Shewanella sp. OMA3-2]UJF23501.1 HupE/UreJ family protein [Shewanella sp. OMA3-2]
MMKVCVILLAILSSYGSMAHQMSTSYLSIKIDAQGQVQGTWQLRLFDLSQLIDIDNNQDGQLTWQEIQINKLATSQYLQSALQISREQTCGLIFDVDQQIDQHFNEGYLVTSFSGQCHSMGALKIDYQAMFEIDTDHKSIVTIEAPEHQYTRVISNDNRTLLINLAESQISDTFVEYVYQGIIHIWKGTDHILFLLALLLTCVLSREQKQWQGIKSKIQIVKQTAWIVTAFTLAHSITLTTTAMGVINFSSHWIELGIALSVLLAALNNVWPVVLRLGWITFAFGLLHGMGFAGVLGELGLPENQKVFTILAFNLGVEVGQLAILMLVLPLLMLVRHTLWYKKWGMQLGSIMIALMAIQWSIERF